MNDKNKKILKYAIPVVFILIAYIGVSYFFSGEIVNFKQRTMEEDRKKQEVSALSDFGLPEPKELKFKNRTGMNLAAWFFPNSKNKDCGVVLVHGFKGTRWGVMKYAPIFWKKGCSVFAYDHRKHGESEGKYGTFGFYEKFDLLDALEFFEKESGISTKKIGILGESMGAATAIQAMALTEKKYGFLIAESSYKDLDSIVGKKAVDIYGSWAKLFIPLAYLIAEIRADFSTNDVSPLNSSASLNIPVLFIHSGTDAYTPYSHSQEIFENTRSSIKEITITDWNSEHSKSINDNYPKFESIVLQFLKRVP